MVKKIFLFLFLFIFTINVNAREIGSFTLAKSGNLTSDYLTLYQGSGNFANWGQGTLVYTFGYTTNNTGSLNLPVLTSAYADSGGKSYVCEFGTVAISSPSTSTNATTGVSYTIACPMNMASNGLTNLGLIFSNQFSQSYVYKYSTSYSVEFITEDIFSSEDIVNAIGQNAYYTQQVIITQTNNLSTILTNQLTNVNTSLQNQNQAITNLNDSITSTDSPSTSETNNTLDDFSENVASDTPITDLLTMPLTLINAYIGGMNSSCTPYNFGSLLGTNLTMPCINLQQRLGSNIWNIIDVLFSIFMIFNISKLFIGAFNKFTTLKDDFSNMYTNDYQPKHGGDE